MRKAATVFLLLSTFFSITSFAQSKIKVDSGFAKVNGTTIYYEVAGKGQPLVLIHGNWGDHRFWTHQFNDLSQNFKVICYDIRGFGKSAVPDSAQVYTDAADLNALMQFLKIDKANICGLSLGSFIAVDMALAYPEKCISLIAVGPRVSGDATGEYKTPDADSFVAIGAKTVAILKEQGAIAATNYLWTGDHAMGRTVIYPETRKVLLQMGYEYSWWRYLHPTKRDFAFPSAIEKLNQIKIPVLIVTSEFDLGLCKDVAAIMQKQISNAKLISLKGAGHLMNMDKPGEFNEAITNFIRSIK